jgi:hypothetical protein
LRGAVNESPKATTTGCPQPSELQTTAAAIRKTM